MGKKQSTDWKQIEDDKEKYQAYMCSREWSVLREQVRERSKDTCERCGVLPMDACHHLTYKRKYREQLEDLQAICNPCHQFTHGKIDFDPNEKHKRRMIDFLGYQSEFPDSWALLIEEFPLSLTQDSFIRVAFTMWLTNADVGSAVESLGLDHEGQYERLSEDVESSSLFSPYVESAFPAQVQFWMRWFRWGCPGLRFDLSDIGYCFEVSRRLAERRLAGR